MRLLVEVREEDEDPLRKLAFNDHRSVREQGGFLLHLAIQAELARRPQPEVESDQAVAVA